MALAKEVFDAAGNATRNGISRLEDVSPQIMMAQAMNEVKQIQNRLALAKEYGPTYAKSVEAQGEVDRQQERADTAAGAKAAIAKAAADNLAAGILARVNDLFGIPGIKASGAAQEALDRHQAGIAREMARLDYDGVSIGGAGQDVADMFGTQAITPTAADSMVDLGFGSIRTPASDRAAAA